MVQLRSKHMQRLRLVHYICPDCIFETTHRPALLEHLEQNHHEILTCPDSNCPGRFHRISECNRHLHNHHRHDPNVNHYLQALYQTCNRRHSRLFNYNGYKYNPTEEFYFEFLSDDYLRNFFGYD